MVTRTFLTKCNTIFEKSTENLGLNNVIMLNYGQNVSRALIYFPLKAIESSLKVNNELNTNGFTHRLKMTNCASIDFTDKYKGSVRASSFDIIAFRIPVQWDQGRGFDPYEEIWIKGSRCISDQGSNWYQAANGIRWDSVGTENTLEKSDKYTDGIYSKKFLYDEYEKFKKGEESVIIAKQHFDFGNEDLDLDITEYVNGCLGENPKYINNGLCLAFSPILEELEDFDTKYVGFFSNNTNTFYHPIVETRCIDAIQDNRFCFVSGKPNRLYLIADEDEIITDVTCIIDGTSYEAKEPSNGVFYVEVSLPSTQKKMLMEDEWHFTSNGKPMTWTDEFTVLPKNLKRDSKALNISPSIYGINDNEDIYQGDKRIVSVIFNIPYSDEYYITEKAYYRIYVKDGMREIDVIDWDAISCFGKEQEFMIKSNELTPSNYFIDIKVENGKETRIFKEVGKFRVVDNATEMIK